jgi:RNA polymerase sigma-70 factor (ECF subfamily)
LANFDDHILKVLDTLGPQIHRLLVRITLSEHAAEDLLQDLFVKILTNPTVDVDNASAYLRQAAIHSAFDWRRRRKVRMHESLTVANPSSHIDVGKDVEEREEIEKVVEALGTLPDALRDVIVLRYFENESFEHIGGLYGRSAHHVRSMLHKGIAKLRITLKPTFTEQLDEER